MNLDDINISEYFDSPIMPYGMKITHLPTGLSVRGNCKHEQSKLNMQRTLVDTLGIFVSEAESRDASLKRKSAMEVENEELRARLARLEEMVMRADNTGSLPVPGQPESLTQPAPKKRGRPAKEAKPEKKGGWTPERRAAAAERMKARQAAKHAPAGPVVDTPMGPMTEEELIRKTMRAPTEPPQRLPKAHTSHGSTVAKTNVDWIKP
jgi:hypothetical protein